MITDSAERNLLGIYVCLCWLVNTDIRVESQTSRKEAWEALKWKVAWSGAQIVK